MKSLFYALVLLAVLVGSVVLLRSLEPSESRVVSTTPGGRQGPAAASAPVESIEGGEAPEAGAGLPADLAAATRLLEMWHPREAARAFERVVDADSAGAVVVAAWVGLIECYSDPFVSREDDMRAAFDGARAAAAAADSSFLDGLRALFVDRDYAAAVDRFQAAARNDPPPDLGYFLARAFYCAGQLDDARKALDRLPEDGKSSGRASALAVRIRVAADDLDGAAELARGLASAHSGEPFPYVLLSQVELLRGNDAEATEFCNNALVIDPRYAPAIVTRSQLYTAAGEGEAARVSYEKLLLFDDPVLQGIGAEGIAFVDFLSGDFAEGEKRMDEAIRHAIAAGSVRRALSYAATLVSYLCELGRAEEADGVVDEWVTGFGDIPEHIARLRILILRGDVESARQLLVQITRNPEWSTWARALSLDTTALTALVHIAAGESEAAVKLIDHAAAPTAAGTRARLEFVRGYATFDGGDAEAARAAFKSVRRHLYGVEFPFHGDPVLDVQSLFFLAEASLAAGAENEAREGYRAFLDRWGAASWNLPAVTRAREKLSSLDAPPAGP